VRFHDAESSVLFSLTLSWLLLCTQTLCNSLWRFWMKMNDTASTNKTGRRAIRQMKHWRYWNSSSMTTSFQRIFGLLALRTWLPPIFLLGYLKETVYKSSSRTLVELKRNIEKAVKKITAETLLRVSRNMCQRVNLRLQENCGHFQHLLWKSLSQAH
jgi:triphosphoribosyl-dephospho-CoA synthetase